MSGPGGRNSGRETEKSRLGRLLPLLLVAAAIAAVFGSGLDDYLTFEALKSHRQAALEWYGENQALAVVFFFFGYALVVALSLPGAVWLSLAGGFVFGTVSATVFVVVAATLGALGIFLIARYALADFFRERMGELGRKMENGFKENAMSYLLVLRLVPVFPFWLVNLVPALLGVPARTYVVGTFIGIIPGTIVFCSIGNGLGAVLDAGGTPDIGIIFEPQIFGPLIALSVLSLVPVAYKRFKASQGESG